jgi:hypothetical protein
MSRWLAAFEQRFQYEDPDRARPIGTIGTFGTGAQQTRNEEPTQSGSRSGELKEPVFPCANSALSAESTADARAYGADFLRCTAGLPDEWRNGLHRLLMMSRPACVARAEWRGLIRGTLHLIDNPGGKPWALTAAQLGWSMLDLWGSHPAKPGQRHDMKGLAWFVVGSPVIAMARDRAVVETTRGSRLTYLRRPPGPGQVLAWKLK